MKMLAAIFLGGGLGALMRHYAVIAASRLFGDGFPYGTLFVNVLGSFLVGVLIETAALKWQISLELRAFLVTGFLGGFTTFSAFSLDVFKLAETGAVGLAVFYVTASIVLSLAAVFGAVFLMRGALGG